jgi:outer membrane lipoprotein-sorting protein
MRQIFALGVVVVLFLSGCATPGLRSDCQKRQQRMERVASMAGQELRMGLTTQEVRALLGEPVEIVKGKGLGDLTLWKYYLLQDCRAYLGLEAPTTELFFLDGKLVKWTTFVR